MQCTCIKGLSGVIHQNEDVFETKNKCGCRGAAMQKFVVINSRLSRVCVEEYHLKDDRAYDPFLFVLC